MSQKICARRNNLHEQFPVAKQFPRAVSRDNVWCCGSGNCYERLRPRPQTLSWASRAPRSAADEQPGRPDRIERGRLRAAGAWAQKLVWDSYLVSAGVVKPSSTTERQGAQSASARDRLVGYVIYGAGVAACDMKIPSSFTCSYHGLSDAVRATRKTALQNATTQSLQDFGFASRAAWGIVFWDIVFPCKNARGNCLGRSLAWWELFEENASASEIVLGNCVAD